MERTNVLQRGSRQLLVSCLAAIVLGLASASSFATTVNGEPSLKVSYGELDLTKPADAEATLSPHQEGGLHGLWRV